MLKVSNWGEFKSLQETNIHKKEKGNEYIISSSLEVPITTNTKVM